MERVELVSVKTVKTRSERSGQWGMMADEGKAVLAKARAGEGVVVRIPGEASLWKVKEHLTRRLRCRGMDVEIKYVEGERSLLVTAKEQAASRAVRLPWARAR